MTVTFAAGEKLLASKLNALPKGIIAYRIRTTSTTAQANEHGVIRFDDIPVEAGRLYRIRGKGQGDVATATDVIRWNLRFTEDGNQPTTASPVHNLDQGVVPNAAVSESNYVERLYVPASNLNYSVLLTISRPTGASNFSAIGSASQTIELSIEDMGADPGMTGVDV